MVPGTACIFEDILARAPVAAQLMAEAQTRGMLEFDAAWKKLLQAGLGEAGGKCTRHWCAGCPMVSSLVDVSGSPCTSWSRMGKRAGRGSPLMCLLLTWCLWARAVRPWVLVHENVVGFDVQVFSQCLEDLYEIQVLVVHPAHVGCGFIRRQRLYVVMYLRGVVRLLCVLAASMNGCRLRFGGWRHVPLVLRASWQARQTYLPKRTGPGDAGGWSWCLLCPRAAGSTC